METYERIINKNIKAMFFKDNYLGRGVFVLAF